MNYREAQKRIRNSDDLCAFVEKLGYRNGNHFPQLQLNNGAHVTSLLNFFDDNPGAIEAIQEFVLDSTLVSDDEDEDEEEVDEDECEEECPTTEPSPSTAFD